MKLYKNIFIKLFIAVMMVMPGVMPTWANQSITGTIKDENGVGLPLANISWKKSDGGVDGGAADNNGNVNIDNIPNDVKEVTVSMVGYDSVTIPVPNGNLDLRLMPSNNQLDEVTVEAKDLSSQKKCKDQVSLLDGVVEMVYNKQRDVCIPTKCDEPRYKLDASKSPAECVYMVGKKCDFDTNNDSNAKDKGTYAVDGNKLICVAECKNADFAKGDDGKCAQKSGPCSADDAAKVANAAATNMVGRKCVATECAKGFKLDNGKCKEEKAEKNQDTKDKTENKTPARTDAEKKLAQDRINELKDNAQKMKEKENSTENKLLGAAGMATVGLGSKDWASGAAEQRVDDKSERDMRAYIETFRCQYGDGTNIDYNEKNVMLPGGNALYDLYQEYITLANNVKSTKTALGLQPGIESEMPIDKATSGLYDDVGIGKTGGAFASVYAAITNPTGEDAKRWNTQREESKKRENTGKTMAIAGAAVSGVANVLINKNAPKENSEKINNKYDKMLTDLKFNVSKIPVPTIQCPSDATGTYPTCKCNVKTHVYNKNTNLCEKCGTNERVFDDTTCICMAGYAPTSPNGACTPLKTGISAKCSLTDPNIVVNPQTGNCTCQNGYTFVEKPSNLGVCTCPADTHEVRGKLCTEKQAQKKPDIVSTVSTQASLPTSLTSAGLPTALATPTQSTQPSIALPSDSLFEKVGSKQLSNGATTELKKFAEQLKSTGDTNYCITVTGHTDPTGKRGFDNIGLSRDRANAVAAVLTANGIPNANITTNGVGANDCTDIPTDQYEQCRKVVIDFNAGSCSVNSAQ